MAAAHPFVQNLRRRDYYVATDVPGRHKLHEISTNSL
jgi:hypothetical protein